MKRISIQFLVAIMFVYSFSASAFSQHQKRRISSLLISANKPAVFISFLGLRDIKPDKDTYDRQNLFFKITNNTRWNIWLQMSGVSKKDYGDASLYYAVRDREGLTISGSIDCHVCSINPVESGKSIVFSMPLDKASYDTFMEMKYSFEWERKNEYTGTSYSQHLVGFAFSNLPESVIARPVPLPDFLNKRRRMER